MENEVLEGYKVLVNVINNTIVTEIALITASVAVYEKIAKDRPVKMKWLKIAWIFFAASIFFGLYTDQFLSFSLIQPNGNDKVVSIRVFAIIHFFLFVIGIVFIIAFGWSSIGEKPKVNGQSGPNEQQQQSRPNEQQQPGPNEQQQQSVSND